MIWTLLFAAVVEHGRGQATLSGRVLDVASGTPVPGAVVALVTLSRRASTGVDGVYFVREIPSGPQHVQVRAFGYLPRSLYALVPDTGTLTLDVALTPVAHTLPPSVIASTLPLPGAHAMSSGAVPDRVATPVSSRHSPLRVEPDALLSLGGGWVRAAAESPDGLSVRGGSTDQVTYHVQGIPVLNPYHASGLFGSWNPDVLARTHLASSRPDPDGPHALSASVGAIIREPGPALEVFGATSSTHTRVAMRGPVGVPGGGFVLSGRQGYPALFARGSDGSFQRGESGDWLGMGQVGVAGGRLRVLLVTAEDELNTQAYADVAGGPPGNSVRNLFEWGSTSVGAAWDRERDETTWSGRAWSARGTAAARWRGAAGGVNLTSLRSDLGASARYRRGGTSVGLRAERLRTDYATRPDTTTAISGGLTGTLPMASALVEHEHAIGARWRAIGGSRGIVTNVGGYFDPHATLEFRPRPQWQIAASWRRAHQFAQSLRNPESLAGSVFPPDLFVASGIGGMPVARGDLGVVSTTWEGHPGVRVGFQVWARTMKGLALVAPVEGGPFATRGFLPGSGWGRGAAVDAAIQGEHWAASGSWGVQGLRLEAGELAFVPVHGVRHQLEAGVLTRPTRTISLRLGVVVEAGRRATLPTGAFEWEACNLKDRGCEFGGSPTADGGPPGGLRLPSYTRFDVGLEKQWRPSLAGREVRLTLYGAFTNVTGQFNVLNLSDDPGRGGRLPIEMRPASPLVFGLDWRR